MYDIYLANGCKSFPDLSDLVDSFPELGTFQFQRRLLSASPEFLGLNLTIDVARKLIRRFKYTEAKGRGMIIPAKYRNNTPSLTAEDAYPIANEALNKMQAQYPDVIFGETVYDSFRDSLMYFTFISPSKKWFDEGLIPGALFANIDKLDGHVWTSEEHMLLRDDIE
jgi:hypothetical protein